MLELGLKLTAAFWLGSIMGGLVLGRLKGGVDLRGAGSGNVGGTNALRTQGALFALGVMIIDVGKGVVAVAWLPGLAVPAVSAAPALDESLVRHACGLGAVLGHMFPVWHGFRGGKGGATAAGVLCALAPSLGVVIIALWIAVIFVTGFVGLATITAAVGAAAFAATRLPEQHGFFVFASLVAALIVYAHRANIARMLDGTESRMKRFFGLGRP